MVYTAYDLPFMAGDFTTYVQAMKAAGVNGIWLGDTVPADVSIYHQMVQAGIKLKAVLTYTGYDPTVWPKLVRRFTART